jgi:hypothetical protein
MGGTEILPYCTLRMTCVEWEVVPDFPVTVTVYCPAVVPGIPPPPPPPLLPPPPQLTIPTITSPVRTATAAPAHRCRCLAEAKYIHIAKRRSRADSRGKPLTGTRRMKSAGGPRDFAVVFTVSVELAGVRLGVMELGLRAQVGGEVTVIPAGLATEHVRLTALAKPFEPVAEIVYVAARPAVMMLEVGLEDRLKSGATVTVKGADVEAA